MNDYDEQQRRTEAYYIRRLYELEESVKTSEGTDRSLAAWRLKLEQVRWTRAKLELENFQMKEALLVLWSELPIEQTKLLVKEYPDVANLLKALHEEADHG